MPLYEFICAKCKKFFEYLVIGSSDKPFCPKCKTKNVKKQFSSFVSSGHGKGCHSCSSHKCSTCG